MLQQTIEQPVLSNDLWTSVVRQGVEVRVEVNQRMLIDKMLARYSSEFVAYRELIQNSDDAGATSFTLKVLCDTSIATHSESQFNGCQIKEIRAIKK